MLNQRSTGILLHITSLPNEYGIGDLGPCAYEFINHFQGTIRWWQILPVHPPIDKWKSSPYFCASAFAGNEMLISLDDLLAKGLLHPEEIASVKTDSTRVIWESVVPKKNKLLRLAYQRFDPGIDPKYQQFIKNHAWWLDEYSIFMALVEENQEDDWIHWPVPLRDRNTQALMLERDKLEQQINYHKFVQFVFYQQWKAVKAYANQRGIYIIGDIPFYNALQSADVWCNPEYYLLDDAKVPKYVSGFPASELFPQGQIWKHPIYNWEAMRSDGYRWWEKKLEFALSYLYDVVRLDHFQGFNRYWKVPYKNNDVSQGEWGRGPGDDFFETIFSQRNLSKQRRIEEYVFVEDVGEENSNEVIRLRDEFGLYGIRILRFAWNMGVLNHYLPHYYPEECVVYTSTHDTNTIGGWWRKISEEDKYFCQTYLQTEIMDPAWQMIEVALSSKANIAIIPMQDLLRLGEEARMNLPSIESEHNWSWRVANGQMNNRLVGDLQQLIQRFQRLP